MVSFITVGKKLAPCFIGLVGKSLSFRDNLSSVKRRPTTFISVFQSSAAIMNEFFKIPKQSRRSKKVSRAILQFNDYSVYKGSKVVFREHGCTVDI
jgi:hypothetical protein